MDDTTKVYSDKQQEIMDYANNKRKAMVADEIHRDRTTSHMEKEVRYVERRKLDMRGEVRRTPEAPFDLNNLPDLEILVDEPHPVGGFFRSCLPGDRCDG